MSNKELDHVVLGPYLLHKDADAAKLGRECYQVLATVRNKTEEIAFIAINKGYEDAYWYDESTLFTVYPMTRKTGVNHLGRKGSTYSWHPAVKGSELMKYLTGVEKEYDEWFNAEDS